MDMDENGIKLTTTLAIARALNEIESANLSLPIATRRLIYELASTAQHKVTSQRRQSRVPHHTSTRAA